MSPLPDAVLLELEGVLLDAHAARRAALVAACADEGIALDAATADAACAGRTPEAAVDAALAALGRPGTDRRSAAPPDDTTRALVALRAERHFLAHLHAGVVLQPDARDVVDALAVTVPLGLVTRARRREVDVVLAAADLASHFACVVTRDDVRVPPPAPDAYHAAVARLARRRPVRTSAVVACVDARTGADAARAAGLRAVRVGPAPASPDDGAAPDVRDGADAWLPALAGRSARALAALLDLAPAPDLPRS